MVFSTALQPENRTPRLNFAAAEAIRALWAAELARRVRAGETHKSSPLDAPERISMTYIARVCDIAVPQVSMIVCGRLYARPPESRAEGMRAGKERARQRGPLGHDGAAELRAAVAGGLSLSQAAVRWGLTVSAVSQIVRGKFYRPVLSE